MSVSFIPFAFILVGGWLIWWGLRRRRQRAELPQGWRRMTGTVLDAGDGVTAPRIEYRTPDGRRLRVPGPTSVPFAVGEEVALLVDPADMTRARLDLTDREAARVVRLLLATGAFLLIIGLITAAVLA